MEVNITIEIIYTYDDIVMMISNGYKANCYIPENNAILNVFIIHNYYVATDFIKILFNVYIAPMIKNNLIIFNRNMIEKILDVIRDIYELFSQNNRIYHLNPTAIIIIDSDNTKYFNFINDRMDIVDVIRINECYYNQAMFTYKCYLYENAIKWI